MALDRTTIMDFVAKARAALDAIEAHLGAAPAAPIVAPQPRPDDWPMEMLPDGMPPAYEGARPLWEAADRERWPSFYGGVFSKWDYLPGLHRLGEPAPVPRYPISGPDGDPRRFERDVRWLGFSPRGQEWLADDRNAALLCVGELGRRYCGRFLGYVIRASRDGKGDEVLVRVPA